jgi:hypothetical protein
MTRDEVLKKIQEARKAIEVYKREGLSEGQYLSERQKIQEIKEETFQLITEAKTIGAAGSVCPQCNGSGRI